MAAFLIRRFLFAGGVLGGIALLSGCEPGVDPQTFLHDGAVRLDNVTITGGSVAGAGGRLFNISEAALVNMSVFSNTAALNSGGGLANAPPCSPTTIR